MTPDGRRIYASHFPRDKTSSNAMSLIDTATNSVPVNGRSIDVAMAPDGRRVYVTDGGEGQLSVVATGRRTVRSQMIR